MLTDSGAALLVAAAERDAGRPGCRSAPGRPTADGPPPEVAEDPAAPALPRLHQRHDRPPARRDADPGRAAGQPGAVPGADPAAGARRRPRAAGAPAVPRLRPQRRLRAWSPRPAPARCCRRPSTRAARSQLMAEEQVTAVPGAPPMYQAWLAVADAAGSDADAAPRLRRDAHGLLRCRPAARGGLDGDARPRRGHRLGGLRPHRGRAGAWPAPWPPAGPSRTASAARCPASSSSCGTPPTDRRVAATTTPTPTTTTSRGPARSGCAAPTCSPATGPTAPTGPDADGWLGTGDLAYRDADGDLHLVDRRSDLILVSGFNVYPAEVERVLDAHPAVAESAVIGVPGPAHRRRRAGGRRPDAGRGRDVRGSCGARRAGRWPGTRCRRRCTSCRRCRTR